MEPVTEERRITTVIFCDLVGSTALAGLLDAEALRSVMLRYFDAMRDRIQACGGTVEKFIGDAVMAVFGVPAIHEDDALQALTAALDMIAALEQLNPELDRVFGIRLQVRIGVNTGEVVAAADPAAGQALVSGEVVNVAARLEQQAPPGQVLIGPDTLRAAGNAVLVTDAGLLTLRGKADPVPAYRLLGIRGDDPELTRRFDTPFVGRGTELGQLDLILSRVQDTRESHLVTIYGDAGIGKTRLARQWLARLHGPGTLIGSGRCRPLGEAGTLTPFADVLRQLLDTGGRPGALAEALAVLDSGLLQDGTPNPSAEDTSAAITQVLSEFAKDRTVVIVVDDCQWGSSTLLDLLDQVHQDLAFDAFLLLCLARPELLGSRPAWGGGRLNASSLALGGLSAREAAQLAAGLADVVAHGDGWQDGVLARAEGNPLHLEQLIGALGETGRSQDLPLTVQALLGARITALPPCHRTLLQIAAVLGREFVVEDVLVLLAQEAATSRRCETADGRPVLRDLIRLRLIEPVRRAGGPPKYRFSSGLIHEAVYHCMIKRVRAERHERTAELIRAACGASARIGTHLEAAFRYLADLGLVGEHTQTVRLAAAAALHTAGATAMARTDLVWAEDLLERALALTPAEHSSWAELARQTAELRLARGRLTEADDLLRDVLSAATAAGDTRTVMHVRLDLAVADPGTDITALAALARDSLAVFGPARDSLGIARASIRVAQEHQFQGRHTAATGLLTRALEHAVRAEAEPERAMALGAIGVSLWQGPVPAAEAVRRCQDLLAEHAERRAVRMSMSCPLAVLHAIQDDFGAAKRRLSEAGDIGRSIGHAEVAVFMPFFAATVETFAGRDEQAEALLREALAAAHTSPDVGMLGTVRLDLARVLLTRGADDQAAVLLAALTGELPPAAAADAYGTRARIAARHGGGDALVLAARALEVARSTDSPVLLATAYLDQAHVLAELDRRRDAATAANRAGVLFGRKGHLPGMRWAGQLIDQLDAA